MKYLRLLEETNDLYADVLQDNKTDYPLVSLSKNGKVINFVKPPIAKAIINVDSENYDFYLNNTFNIKKLWIDNQFVFNKNLWVKYEDTISMNDFGTGNYNLTTFNKPYLYTQINHDCANIRIKSTEKITRFYLMVSDLYGYGIEYVSGDFLDFDTMNSFPFQVKKIDDYTYDISDLFKYELIDAGDRDHVLLLGATDSDVLPEQTISYEILEEDKARQSMTINSDNAFDLHNHGTDISITGDFNENDLLLINLILDGEILDNSLVPIQTIVEYGLGSFNNNVLDCNLDFSGIIGGNISYSYAIIDGSFNDSYVENIEDVLPYIKNVTITFKPAFIFPFLEDGEHELKFEVISKDMMPLFNRETVKQLDFSKLVGMETLLPYVFSEMENLERIILPNSLKYIGDDGFYRCFSLKNITCLAKTAPELGDDVFAVMPDNGVLRVPTGSDYSAWLNELPSDWTIEYI